MSSGLSGVGGEPWGVIWDVLGVAFEGCLGVPSYQEEGPDAQQGSGSEPFNFVYDLNFTFKHFCDSINYPAWEKRQASDARQEIWGSEPLDDVRDLTFFVTYICEAIVRLLDGCQLDFDVLNGIMP